MITQYLTKHRNLYNISEICIRGVIGGGGRGREVWGQDGSYHIPVEGPILDKPYVEDDYSLPNKTETFIRCKWDTYHVHNQFEHLSFL